MITARQALLERARTAVQAVPVPSPCISVCRIDPARATCEGCFRTLDEIAAWSRLDETGKRAVWRAIAERAEQAA